MPIEPLAPMSMIRYTDNFQEVSYALALNGAFDLTTPIQALQLEAGARGKAVIIQVALVDLDMYYNQPQDEEGNPDHDQPTE